jgi:hypothetical protein
MRQWFANSVLSNALLIRTTITAVRRNIAAAREKHARSNLADEGVILHLFQSFDGDPVIRLDYFRTFLGEFQTETSNFYGRFSEAHFKQNPFPVYLQLSREQFEHEEGILRQVLPRPTQTAVLAILHGRLLIEREGEFLTAEKPARPIPPIADALQASDQRPIEWLVDLHQRFECELTDISKACAQFTHDQMAARASTLKAPEVVSLIDELMKKAITLGTASTAAFRDVPKARDALEEKIKPEFDIPTNFCTFVDQQIKTEFKNLQPDERAIPQTVGLFCTRLEDKKMFGNLSVAFMVRRFIKMDMKLSDLEFPVISAIRRAKTPELAKPSTDSVKKVKEALELEADFSQNLKSARDPEDQGVAAAARG